MNFIFLLLFLGTVYIKNSESINCDRTPKTTEARLKTKLFCDYDKSMRPIGPRTNTTVLIVRLVIKHFDYSDDQQSITIHSWMPLSYDNSNFSWTPSNYDNIEHIVESSNTLWMPEISLYNSKAGRGDDACYESECRITFRGRVMCVMPCSHTALCKADFSRWPFDRQSCTLTMGTWLTPGELIDYDANRTTIISDNHLQHKQWRLISTSNSKNRGNISPSSNETFPSLDFKFVIERHSAIHIAVIFAPALIMIAINLISIWLDLRSLDRLLLIAVNLTVHFSYIQQVSWYVPKNGENSPTVILFFRDSMIITTILLLETFIIRSLGKCQSIMPYWIDAINNFIINTPISIYFVLDKAPIDPESNDSGDAQTLLKAVSKESPNNQKWQQFAKIVDRLLFIVFVITYLVMVISLIPASYANDGSLEKILVET